MAAETAEDTSTPVVARTIVMHQSGQVHRLQHHPGETLLEAARRAGLNLSSNCERGECGTCMLTILSGQVHMRENHVLSEEDLREGLALGCQSLPITEVVEVELP